MFGDVLHLLSAVRVTIRKRRLRYLTGTLWVIRERHRLGEEPFTFRDYLNLRRQRARMRDGRRPEVQPRRGTR